MRARTRLGLASVCAVVAAASLWCVIDVAPGVMTSLLPVLQLMLHAAVVVGAVVGMTACLFGPANLMDMTPVDIWRWFWSRTPGGVMARGREMLGMGTRRGK